MTTGTDVTLARTNAKSDERLAAALTDVVDVLIHPNGHGGIAFSPLYIVKRVKATMAEFDAALVARVQDVLLAVDGITCIDEESE